jgi:lysophospholipase L1-like esterase
MARKRWLLALVTGAMLITTQPIVAGASDTPPLPASIAAVGDSISQAVSSGGSLGATYPANSWSTGTTTSVDSHYLRLLDLVPAINGHAYNRSVSGADMADLQGQVAGIVPLAPDYLTILIGGNDLCTDTVDQMTPVSTFRDEFTAAMDTLTAGSPGTRVLVASIPEVYQLWDLFHTSWLARTVWSLGDICQSLLANPTSTRTADVGRRAEVAQRNVDYNTVLEEVCAQYARCRFDGNAVYDVTFTKSDVAGDYFHPSIAGQAKLAAVTWAAGYWPNGGPVTDTPPTASFTSSCTDLTCRFDAASSTDDNGIATYAWTFGDGFSGAGATVDHEYKTAGTYQVGLTVTDGADHADAITHAVTVTAPAGDGTVHLSALDGSSTGKKSGWIATITLAVADNEGAAVSGAIVTGTWSTGASGGCTTTADGSCSFSTNMNKKATSATWIIAGITATGATYNAAANVSGGTITVDAP